MLSERKKVVWLFNYLLDYCINRSSKKKGVKIVSNGDIKSNNEFFILYRFLIMGNKQKTGGII